MKIILLCISLQIVLFGLNLSESIDLAINNSPTVSLSESNIKYSKYMEDDARSAYHPTIQAGFNWQKLETPTAFAFSPSHNYSLGLKYNLFNGLSDISTIDSKQFELEATKLEKVTVIADLKLSVIRAYTDYLKAEKNIKAQEEQLTSLIKQYNNTNIRYEEGIVAKNDLLLIEVDKLKAEQELIRAKSNVTITKNNLEHVMAICIIGTEVVEDFDASVKEIEDAISLENKMLKNRSEMKIMKLKSKSLLSQKDAVVGYNFPKVDFEASYQVNDKERFSGSSVFQPKDQTTYIVNVKWDLYSGGKNIALKKALLEKNNQQNFQLQQLKLDLKNQLVKAYEEFKVISSAKYVASRAKESATENFRITSERYSYGEVDTLTLLVSQSNLTQAINKDNNTYYDLYVAYKTLQRIVGE